MILFLEVLIIFGLAFITDVVVFYMSLLLVFIVVWKLDCWYHARGAVVVGTTRGAPLAAGIHASAAAGETQATA